MKKIIFYFIRLCIASFLITLMSPIPYIAPTKFLMSVAIIFSILSSLIVAIPKIRKLTPVSAIEQTIKNKISQIKQNKQLEQQLSCGHLLLILILGILIVIIATDEVVNGHSVAKYILKTLVSLFLLGAVVISLLYNKHNL
jgi:cobalamin biosynthesis protein CobD/CbiB